MPEFWLISVPGEQTCNESWERLNKATSVNQYLATNYKFNIPDLKVGTLDQLVGLSDDFTKLDAYCESVTRKLVTYFAEVLEEQRDKLLENLLVNDKDYLTFLTRFQWQVAKYPVKQSLRAITEIINKQVAQIDNDLKTKATAYNNLKNSLASLEKKATGSLLTKDLADIVKADDFVLNSEYLCTQLVIVPKVLSRDWETKYEKLADMVVPRSSKLIYEDNDQCLFSVTLFKKVIDEYKLHCRENKFIVREFVYDQEILNAGKNEREKLMADKQKQFGPLVRWLKINFGEIYSAFCHVKALRVFVESVLRYGLPVNFQAVLMQPGKKSNRKLRELLNQMYSHLDSANMGTGNVDNLEDMPSLMHLGGQDYYPYVFIPVNIDFVELK